MTTTIITGYTGERHITPSMDSKVYRGIFGNDDYILAEGNQCSGSMTDANTFVIMDGVVSLQGRQIQQSQETLSIATCASGYQRHDLVVMRYTHDANTGIDGAELAVIQGTAVTNYDPQDPDYNTGNIDDGANPVDMPLYRVALDGSSYDVQQLAPCLFDTTQSDLMLTDEVTDALDAIGITVSGGVVQAVKALAELLADAFVVETFSGNIPTGQYYATVNVTTSKAGYTPVAIVSAGSNQANIYMSKFTVFGTTAQVVFVQRTGASLTTGTYTIKVLFIKDGIASIV